MSQKSSRLLSALYSCWFLGLLAYLVYIFATSSDSPDSLHMTPFPDLPDHRTVYLSVHERWQLIALMGATAMAAIGTQWARLVWYCKYREAGGKPESPVVQI
jgi:hypothetical protein